MHLADALIQSDLFRLYILYQYVCSLGIEPTTFCTANAMLHHWATETQILICNLFLWIFSIITPVFSHMILQKSLKYADFLLKC